MDEQGYIDSLKDGYWITAYGKQHDIKRMTNHHLSNAREFLRKKKMFKAMEYLTKELNLRGLR